MAHGVLEVSEAHQRWPGRMRGWGRDGGRLTGAQVMTERRRGGREEQRWLELIAWAKEGGRERERELGSEGERGGGGRGCPRVYREAGGGIGEGNNQQLIAMTPLMAGGRVKRV
jgi:hypothetical protein